MIADADWANVSYYQSESVLFLHEASNDMRAAASNIFKNKKVFNSLNVSFNSVVNSHI